MYTAIPLRRTLIAGMIGLVAPVAASAQSPTLDDFSFLTGCWVGTMGSLDMREHWTENEGGMLMWTTRFFRDGEVVDWEFGLLQEVEAGLVLVPYPRGSKSEHAFPLVRWEEEYVFENLEHDFPVRIIYRRVGEDGLAPRIEGRDGQGPGWSLTRAECPSGGP